ncbi:MAG: tryptophan synthase subunit alpha [Armatimonadota bacterium]
MSRIAGAFAALRGSGYRALIPFLMAGDPSLEASASFLQRFAEAGADVLEIGVPFSDPIADGPVNERAAQRALRAGASLPAVLDLAAGARRRLAEPIVFLSYYNPILQFGIDAFCRRAAAAGVDGIVIPDLPPEEGAPLAAAADSVGLDVVFLAAPTSTDERLRHVAAASRGFVYCVSLTGVTGVRSDLSADVGGLVERLRRHTPLPVCVGFGVSTPAHARQVAAVADGVIVGSAIVAIIEREGASAGPALAEFIRGLRAGVDSAVGAVAP